MDALGVTEAVLPELAALGGVEQSHYHHLDVARAHARGAGRDDRAERDPGAGVRRARRAAVRAVLAEPLANELTRGEALRFGALLHDIAKPQTRAVTAAGRVTFIGHDRQGAELAAASCAGCGPASGWASYVAALVRHHLRLGLPRPRDAAQPARRLPLPAGTASRSRSR